MLSTTTMALILEMLVVVVAFFTGTQGQLAPPTDSAAIIGPFGTTNDTIIMPMSVAQCESLSIFYRLLSMDLNFQALPSFETFINITVPTGTGYLEWICNIPAGQQFLAPGDAAYTVHNGSSSSCLGNLTTTYSLASYSTRLPRLPPISKTSTPSFALLFYSHSAPVRFVPLPYPTGSFATITVNYDSYQYSTSF
jgi:hypothetical protein